MDARDLEKKFFYLLNEGFEVGKYICSHCHKVFCNAHHPEVASVECDLCHKMTDIRGRDGEPI